MKQMESAKPNRDQENSLEQLEQRNETNQTIA
jgi:hypothetical protein